MIHFRIEHQERENKQQKSEHYVEIQQEQHHQQEQQQHQQPQHNVMDEGDGNKSNHSHPKLDLKNFHTQLW